MNELEEKMVNFSAIRDDYQSEKNRAILELKKQVLNIWFNRDATKDELMRCDMVPDNPDRFLLRFDVLELGYVFHSSHFDPDAPFLINGSLHFIPS